MKDILMNKLLKNMFVTITAIIIMMILVAMDLTALNDMFIKNGATSGAALFSAFVLAIILEGGPFFTALSLITLRDKTITRKNEKNGLTMVFIAAISVTLFIFIYVVYTRYQIIDSSGGLDVYGIYHSGFSKYDFFDSEGKVVYNKYYEGYFHDLSYMFLPIGTSIISFLISTWCFKTDNIQKLRDELNVKQNHYLETKEDQAQNENVLRDAILKIQTKLGIDERPDSVVEFKEQCLNRIQEILRDEAEYYYRVALDSYNNNIVAELEKYKLNLSKISNIDYVIREIDINKDIIGAYPQWEAVNPLINFNDNIQNAFDQATSESGIGTINQIKNPKYIREVL